MFLSNALWGNVSNQSDWVQWTSFHVKLSVCVVPVMWLVADAGYSSDTSTVGLIQGSESFCTCVFFFFNENYYCDHLSRHRVDVKKTLHHKDLFHSKVMFNSASSFHYFNENRLLLFMLEWHWPSIILLPCYCFCMFPNVC